MKKWLVGLLAAGLCVASAWAVTDTLEAGLFAATSTTYKDFSDVTVTSSAVYAGNSAKTGAGGIQLRSKDNSGIVTTASGGTATKVTIAWADGNADGRTIDVYGKSDAYSSSADLYAASSQGTKIGSIVLGSTELAIEDEYAFIGLRSSSGALYLDSVAIEWSGEAPPVEFSISLDPAEPFDVVQGKSASITATVKGAQGDVSYSWSVNGTPIELAGNVYTVDSAELGEYEVSVEASDGVSEPVSASVFYTVVEAPIITGDDYTLITSADGLKDGTLVVLTDPDSTLALKAEVASSVFGVASVADAIAGDVLTTDDASIVWKLVDDGNGNFSLYNEDTAKYAGHAGTDSNSGRLQDDAFPLAITVGEDNLFVLASITADAKGAFRDLQFNQNGTNPRFAYYKGTQKNLRVYAAETGPAEPKVVFSGETTVEVGQSFELQFTLKNYEGEYSWTVEGAGSISDEGLFTYEPAEAGVTVVMVKALDGEGNVIAQSIDIQLTANEPAKKYTIAIAEGIENGTVTADKAEAEVGEIVTLTITPAAGYKLDSVSVNDGAVAVTGNTFVMPAANVTVSATFVEVTGTPFTLITSLDDLEDGAEYVITDNSQGYAITAALSDTSTKRLQSTVVAPVEGVITTDDAAIIWKLVKDDDGNFALYNASIEKYIGWSSGNSAKFQDDAFANTISYESDLFVVMATSTAELDKPRKLQFNSASNTLQFAYYEGAQKNLCFFKAGGSAALSVSFDQANPLKIDVGTSATVTAVAKGGEAPYAFVWESSTEELNGTDAALAIPATLAKGTYTATVTVTDNAGIEVSKPFAIIVSEPAVAHDVKIAVGIQGGVVTADPDKATVGETVTLTATPESGKKLVSMTVTYGETTLTFTSSPAEFEMPDTDVDVGATFEEVSGQAFTLVTSLDGLEDGAEYVITDNSQGYAITAALSDTSTKRLQSTVVAPVEGVITTDDAAIIWKLVKDDDGNFALYNASIEKYIGWSSGNSAKFQDDAFANTISYESDLFVVMATSTAELEKPRKLQFNSAANTLQFAYYEGAQKNLCFFKASGAAKPSISFEGETTVEAGQQVSLQFTLKNYDGDYAWAVDSREGGSIDASGLYTWTPSEAGDVTIKVKAVDGETEIASKEVALTVTAPEPPATSIVCNLGTSVEATVGVPVTFEFTVQGEGVESVDDWYAEWRDGDEIALDYGDENKSASFTWTPGAAGSFAIDVNALVQPNNQLLELAVAVTVSEGGGDVLEITGFSSSKDGLCFEVPAGVSVEAATSLVDADWTAIDIAPVDGKVTIPFEGDGKFYRLAK